MFQSAPAAFRGAVFVAACLHTEEAICLLLHAQILAPHRTVVELLIQFELETAAACACCCPSLRVRVVCVVTESVALVGVTR